MGSVVYNQPIRSKKTAYIPGMEPEPEYTIEYWVVSDPIFVKKNGACRFFLSSNLSFVKFEKWNVASSPIFSGCYSYDSARKLLSCSH